MTAPGSSTPAHGETEHGAACEHEYVWTQDVVVVNSYYDILEVTNKSVCKHCQHTVIHGSYQCQADSAPWMPFED